MGYEFRKQHTQKLKREMLEQESGVSEENIEAKLKFLNTRGLLAESLYKLALVCDTPQEKSQYFKEAFELGYVVEKEKLQLIYDEQIGAYLTIKYFLLNEESLPLAEETVETTLNSSENKPGYLYNLYGRIYAKISNHELACENYKISADKHDPEGQYLYACHLFDIKIPQLEDKQQFAHHTERAYDFLRYSIAQNYTPAQVKFASQMLKLAINASSEENVSLFYKKANDLLDKAIAKNNPEAFKHRGQQFENGWGQEKNIEQALYYYRKAAILGNEDAHQSIHELYADKKIPFLENSRLKLGSTFEHFSQIVYDAEYLNIIAAMHCLAELKKQALEEQEVPTHVNAILGIKPDLISQLEAVPLEPWITETILEYEQGIQNHYNQHLLDSITKQWPSSVEVLLRNGAKILHGTQSPVTSLACQPGNPMATYDILQSLLSRAADPVFSSLPVSVQCTKLLINAGGPQLRQMHSWQPERQNLRY